MDAVDLDGVLGYGYHQLGDLGDGQLDFGCGIDMERRHSYRMFLFNENLQT